MPALRLQRILEEAGVAKVDALKIDIEGFEDRALVPFFKEAPQALWPRAVVIEHLSRDEWQLDCIADMLARGYAEAGRTRSNTLLLVRDDLGPLVQAEALMIDHIGLPFSDYERAKTFYLKALAPLGYALVMEVKQQDQPEDTPAAGFGANGKPDFWIGGEGGLNKPLHVAILAGPRCRGCFLSFRDRRRRTRQRRARHSRTLSSELLRRLRADPDGHNIEEVGHTPE